MNRLKREIDSIERIENMKVSKLNDLIIELNIDGVFTNKLSKVNAIVDALALNEDLIKEQNERRLSDEFEYNRQEEAYKLDEEYYTNDDTINLTGGWKIYQPTN